MFCRPVCFLSLLFALVSGPMSAQTAPETENEWARAESLMPVVESEGLVWILEMHAKVPGLTRIEVRDPLDSGKTPLLVVDGKAVYSKGPHRGGALPSDRYSWVYEEGATYRLPEVSIYRGSQIRRLHIPVSLSEGTKGALRVLLYERLGQREPVRPINPYQLFDGRKWLIRNAGQNDQRTLVVFTLENESLVNYNELVSQSMIFTKKGIRDYLPEIRDELRKNCVETKWQETWIGNEMVLYEWSRGPCGELPPQHELATLRRTQKGLLQSRYFFRKETMPEKNYAVWKRLLTGR